MSNLTTITIPAGTIVKICQGKYGNTIISYGDNNFTLDPKQEFCIKILEDNSVRKALSNLSFGIIQGTCQMSSSFAISITEMTWQMLCSVSSYGYNCFQDKNTTNNNLDDEKIKFSNVDDFIKITVI